MCSHTCLIVWGDLVGLVWRKLTPSGGGKTASPLALDPIEHAGYTPKPNAPLRTRNGARLRDFERMLRFLTFLGGLHTDPIRRVCNMAWSIPQHLLTNVPCLAPLGKSMW